MREIDRIELSVTRRTVGFDSPHGPATLPIYQFDVEHERADAPLVLYSHGGSIRSTPALRGGFPHLVAAARAAGSRLRFAAVDHRGATSHALAHDYCLADRVLDLEVARSWLLEQSHSPVVLMGTSMGGHVVTMATRRFSVAALVLSCPAAYSERAHHTRFGPAFTEELRRPDSWHGSPAFTALADGLARGTKVALRLSLRDQIIPRGVSDEYRRVVERAGAPNRVIDTDSDHHTSTAEAREQLLRFLADCATAETLPRPLP